MKTNKILMATMSLVLAGVALNANAQTATTTISPSLTITSTCAITGATIANFAPQPFGGGIPATATGTMTVTCAGGVTAYNIGANWGTSSGRLATQRVMTNGTDDIKYKLGISGAGIAAVTTVTDWTDKDMLQIGAPTMSSGASATQGAVGASEVYTISADVTETALAMSTKSSGVYGDSVTVTVEW